MPLAEHDAVRRQRARQALVSIHVPLAEHDYLDSTLRRKIKRFNSRAPRGARHRHKTPSRCSDCRFNSRAPRGARRSGH